VSVVDRVRGSGEARGTHRRRDDRAGIGEQRSLLAALLLHPGRTVPIRRLIQTLRGDEPPPSAVDLGLAEWGEADTYRLPPLMRLFSAELGALVPAQRAALSW